MLVVRNGLVGLGVALVALMILELGLRTLRPTPPLPDYQSVGWNARSSLYRLVPSADPTYVKDPNPQINQAMTRGRMFTRGGDAIRVVLVGDSQVEAAALPFADQPEVTLEELLRREFDKRFEVRSIGVGGWGQAQQLVALRRHFQEFKADYVFLWHTQGNDYWENGFPDRSTSSQLGYLKPTFVLDAVGLAEFHFDAYKNDSPGYLSRFEIYRRTFRIAERFGLVSEPRLLADYYRLIPAADGHKKAVPGECPPTTVEQYAYSANRGQFGHKAVSLESSEAFLEGRSHFAGFLRYMSERDKYLVRVTRALMTEMRNLVNSQGSELVIFYSDQSYKDGTHRYPRGSCVGNAGGWYELADVAERTRENLDGLNAIELNTVHMDTTFDQVSISRTDRHLNKLGNELVFQELAKALKERGLLFRRSSRRD